MENLNERASEIYGQFKHMFPTMVPGVTYWGQWSEHAIRIELTSEIVLLFEYRDANDWKLCTETNELIRLEKNSRNKHRV